MAPISWVN